MLKEHSRSGYVLIYCLFLFGFCPVLFSQVKPASPDSSKIINKDRVEEKGEIKNKEVDLKEVVVTATRSPMRMNAKGTSLDIGLLSKTRIWTLKDALEEIPGIEINGGEITYQGQSVRLKENGFFSPNLQQNLGNYLNMPASDFVNIDLLLKDLSTREGGASLNFVRAKRFDGEYWGNAGGSAGLVDQRFSGLIGLAKGKSLFEITPNFSRNVEPEATSSSYVRWKDANRENYTSSTTHRSRRTGSGNLHYNLNLGKHLLDFNLMLRKNKLMGNDNIGTLEYNNQILYNQYTSHSKMNNEFKQFDFTAGYRWMRNKTSHLNASLQIEYPSNNVNNSVQTSSLEAPDYDQQRKFSDRNYFGLVSYDFIHPSFGEFELGGKYFNRNQHNEVHFVQGDTASGDPLIRESAYDNTYHYGAAFASWAKVLGECSVLFVLTADYSRDLIPTYSSQHYDYFTLNPYVSLSRRFGIDQWRMTVEYKERRPSISMLNPIADPVMTPSGIIVLEGNPNLKPLKRIQSRLNYSSTWFTNLRASMSFSYNYSWDNFQNLNYLQDTVMHRKYVNMNKNHSIYFSSNFNWQISKKWFTSFSLTLDPSGDQLLQNSKMSWNLSDSERLTIAYGILQSGKTMLSVSGGITHNKLASYQFSSSDVWIPNLGISGTFFRNKLTASLSLSNFVQPTYSQTNYFTAIGYESETVITRRQFDINASIQYRFGKIKSAPKGKSIKIDDI